jgi:hypothetical protein
MEPSLEPLTKPPLLRGISRSHSNILMLKADPIQRPYQILGALPKHTHLEWALFNSQVYLTVFHRGILVPVHAMLIFWEEYFVMGHFFELFLAGELEAQ